MINLVKKNMAAENLLTESLQKMFQLFKRSNDPADVYSKMKVEDVMGLPPIETKKFVSRRKMKKGPVEMYQFKF